MTPAFVQPDAEDEQQEGAHRPHQGADLLGEPTAVDGRAQEEDDSQEDREPSHPGEDAAAEETLELDPRDRVRRRRGPMPWWGLAGRGLRAVAKSGRDVVVVHGLLLYPLLTDGQHRSNLVNHRSTSRYTLDT